MTEGNSRCQSNFKGWFKVLKGCTALCSHQRCRLTEEQPGAFVIIWPRHSWLRSDFFKTQAYTTGYGLKLFLASLCVSSGANVVRTSTGFVQTKNVDTSCFDRPSLLFSAEGIGTQNCLTAGCGMFFLLKQGRVLFIAPLTTRSAFGCVTVTSRSAFGCLSQFCYQPRHNTHTHTQAIREEGKKKGRTECVAEKDKRQD